MEGFVNKFIDFLVLCNEIVCVFGIQGSVLVMCVEFQEVLFIDWFCGESLWGLKYKLVKEINCFCSDIIFVREIFVSLIEQQDFVELKVLVYCFKGVVGNFGLIKIMYVCKVIEQDCYDKVVFVVLVVDLYSLVLLVQSVVVMEQDNDL